jgi:hypothetical protein
MKFKDDTITKVKDHLRNTKELAEMAGQTKRKEVEDAIPDSVKGDLTPEQIKRAGNIGMAVGIGVLFLLLLLLAWKLWGVMFG